VLPSRPAGHSPEPHPTSIVGFVAPNMLHQGLRAVCSTYVEAGLEAFELPEHSSAVRKSESSAIRSRVRRSLIQALVSAKACSHSASIASMASGRR
jgi:hypothetical protein